MTIKEDARYPEISDLEISEDLAAILGVGRATKRVVVEEREDGDAIVVRPMMNMTLSADHRLVDGAMAAAFLQDIVQALERPSKSST